jgi:hypothetical protein
MAAALRPAIAIAAMVAAVAGAVPPVSLAWLGAALGLLCLWTPVYLVVGWNRGLRPWLVVIDLCIAAVLSLAIGRLVPGDAVEGLTSWVSFIAAMAVISAQLSGRLALSVPGGLLVAGSLAAGQRIAGSPDGGMFGPWLMTIQLAVGAGVMVIAAYVERASVRAFARLQETQETSALALARREDERAQLRLVHNGPLTTLTMALDPRASATLTHRASAALEALPRLAQREDRVGAAPGAGEGADGVRLDERLAQVVVWYEPPLRITARLHPALVPPVVADAFTGAVSEALENVTRYAATGQAAVELESGGPGGAVRVTVTDHGRGFEPGAVARYGFGLREDLGGRMVAAGGTAVVRSSPGTGTVVELEWRRG